LRHELVDDRLDERRRDHQPDRTRFRQLVQEVLDR
jgi:hypothetical protein